MRLREPILVCMMLIPAAAIGAENPWKSKVAGAVEHARRTPSAAALREALDVTYRADDWAKGLELADLARDKNIRDEAVQARAVRALWRAGRIEAAEKAAARLDRDTKDPVALQVLSTIDLSRGDLDNATPLADRLAALDDLSAESLAHVFTVRFAAHRMEGLTALIRKLESRIDEKNGFPDLFLSDTVDGLPAFLDAAGEKPLNRLVEPGSAPIRALVMIGLPAVDVEINGRGPYKMVVDTGGSIMLSLDQHVADELGLKSLGTATVRGVSGKQDTGQALLDDVQMGSIRLSRVICRTFDVRGAVMNAADGIIGTGIFADGRMTLDFAGATIAVSRSSAQPAAGFDTPMRLVGDAKLMALVELNDGPGVALLDTGADAVAMAPSKLEALFPGREILRFDPGIGIGVGGTETPEVSIGPGAKLVFGGRTFPSYGGVGLDVLDNLLSPILGVQTDILIGMPAFREMRSLTVDFPRAKLWIDWLDRTK